MKKGFLKRIGGYFGCLKGNDRVCIAFHPLWGVPYTFYTYYISLYLKEIGLTDTALGRLMVAGTVASFLFSFISAPLVDRMGRKRSTFVFDLLSSALPPLVYLFSKNFFFALLAVILFNSNKIMSIAYYLVMIEDSDEESRIVAFNLFNIITVAAGLLIPIAGIFVDKYGVVATERVFLIVSFLMMTAMILFRNMLLKETAIGEKLRAASAGKGLGAFFKEAYKPYGDAMAFLRRNRAALLFVLINILFYVYMNLGSNYSLYFVPYFTDRLGMDAMQSSVLGSVYYGGMLFAMILINPLFGRRGLIFGVRMSALVTLLGLVALVVIPAKAYALAIAATLVMALGYGMLKSEVDGGLAVYTGSEYQSGVYALANLFSSGLGIVVTALCAVLYPHSPRWLYILCSALVFLILLGACLVKEPNQAERK